MKPFDIELAKQGKPVCLRDGRKARIICFDVKNSDYPILALVEDGEHEVAMYVNERGENRVSPSGFDLMMASEKKTGWINIYPQINIAHIAEISEGVYPIEAVAKLYAQADCVATIPIEWEE